MTRTLRTLAALAMVALISAGCSNAPAETGTGSNGGNTTAATHEQAVKFAECMRDNGVREFPDPDVSGEFAYGIERGSSLDPSTAAWKTAIGACKDLQPPGALGDGEVSAEEQEARLKFAQCMRDNGVKDFPDPTKNRPLIDTSRVPSAAGKGARSIPGFTAAMEKCRDLLAESVGNQ
jgi:hypothetical protein